MAVAANFDTVKKEIVSILQASQTAYGAGTTGNQPDGSNQMFPSSEEINDTALSIDGEVCTAIVSTLGHPYAPQFSLETSALTSGSQVIKNVGVVQKVTTLNGIADEAFSSANVNVTTNAITIANSLLTTGQKVRFTTTGTLPTGVVVATDYWTIRDNDGIKFATSIYNSNYGINIDLTGAGSGNSTIVIQYVDAIRALTKGQVINLNENPQVYGSRPAYVANRWFIEGNVVYTSSPFCKVTYTDYTRTSALQAPESYTTAIIAGAVAKLSKDGFDTDLAQFYAQIYAQMLEEIRAGAKLTPEI